jgi:hypothetical protein
LGRSVAQEVLELAEWITGAPFWFVAVEIDVARLQCGQDNLLEWRLPSIRPQP